MNLISKAAFITAAMVVALPAASMAAGTATGNIIVSATVNSVCTMQVNNLAFGTYDPLVTNATAALTGNTAIAVTCTQGSNPVLTLAAGTGVPVTPGGTTGTSAMALQGGAAGATPLSYTFALGANTNANAGGISQPFSFPVNGVIGAGQDVANGSYQDTLVATVSF